MKTNPYFIFILLYTLCSGSLKGQLNFNWATSDVPDIGVLSIRHCIATDNIGNVYIGCSENFQTPYTSVKKYSISGDLVWEIPLQHAYLPAFVEGIVVSDDGEVYITGQYSGNIDFDPGPATAHCGPDTLNNPFVAKYNANGSFIWVKCIPGIGDANTGTDLAIDNNKNIYFTGVYSSSLDFSPLTGLQSQNIDGSTFIAKCDSNGNFMWVKGITNTGWVLSHKIVYDGTNSIYIGGEYYSSTDFNPSLSDTSILNNNGLYVLKLNTDGDFIHANKLLNVGFYDLVYSDGKLFLAGHFGGTLDFDLGPGTAAITSNGALDGFVAEFDTTGNYIWAAGFGGAETDDAFSLCKDKWGNLFVGGYLQGECYFGDTVVPANNVLNKDIFIAKFGPDNNFEWVATTGTVHDFCGLAELASYNNKLYALGAYSNTIDVDFSSAVHNLFMAGPNSSNGFLAQYTVDADVVSVTETSVSTVKLYPNPAQNMVVVEVPDIKQKEQFVLTDITGKILVNQTLIDTKTTIDLNGLSSGIYLWRVGEKAGKLIVE